MAHFFHPELTLDHQTSLSSPANTGAWFVSSTHIDPWVLHTDVWDHQVPCAEYLDSLHADGTPVYSGKRERERSRRMEKNWYRAAKKDQVSICAVCIHVRWAWAVCVYYSKDQSGLKSASKKDSLNVLRIYSHKLRGSAISGPPRVQGCSFHSEVCDSQNCNVLWWSHWYNRHNSKKEVTEFPRHNTKVIEFMLSVWVAYML